MKRKDHRPDFDKRLFVRNDDSAWPTGVRALKNSDFAEIAKAEGYVKLDGIDVEALSTLIRSETKSWYGHEMADECVDLAEAVIAHLAALDPQEDAP
jgi:hypothetical protein